MLDIRPDQQKCDKFAPSCRALQVEVFWLKLIVVQEERDEEYLHKAECIFLSLIA